MWKRLVSATIAAPALIVISGCAGSGYGGTGYSTPAYSSPGYSAPSRFTPASETPRDKEQRGNTPVGMDRTGGGPASGAILDPTGAVTKEPVQRDR
jgi:hypothetical protein